MDRRVGRMGYCRGTVKMDFWKILSSQPRHLEGPFLLVWIDLIKEISAEPSLVQKLLLVEEIWISCGGLGSSRQWTCGAAAGPIFIGNGLGGADLVWLDSS